MGFSTVRQTNFPGGTKLGTFPYTHSKLREQPSFYTFHGKISKFRGPWLPARLRKKHHFMLNTGTNCNVIDASVLTQAEKVRVDTRHITCLVNFDAHTPSKATFRTLQLSIRNFNHDLCLPFHVMPEHSLHCSIISLQAVTAFFLPLIG